MAWEWIYKSNHCIIIVEREHETVPKQSGHEGMHKVVWDTHKETRN